MPKISKPLCNTDVKNFKPYEKAYKKPDGKGLWILIKPNGSKMWRFDFKYANKNLSMSFGLYPDVSLKEAREARKNARDLLSKNINPILEKKNKLLKTITLDVVINEWIELKSKSSSEATITQHNRMFKNFTKFYGDTPIKLIKRKDIIYVLEMMQNRGVVESTHRLFSLINKLYMYATTKEYIEHNIISDIDASSILIPRPTDNHYAAITSPDEIKELLIDINTISKTFRSDISVVYIFKLIPYVFVRSENIRLMRWDELDLDNNIWIIPKEKMKTKIDFVCPLPRQAVEIIKNIEPYSKFKGEFVFPSPLKKDRGVSGATLSDTLSRLGYKDRHTFHGFRSMFSTTAYNLYKEHGYHSDIIEACLSHKEQNKIKAAYNREEKFKYIDEKKELVQWYANWLDKLRDS